MKLFIGLILATMSIAVRSTSAYGATASFTVSNTALGGTYTAGESFKLSTSIKANAGSPTGLYTVELRIENSEDKVYGRHYFYSQSLSASAATTLSYTYTVPAGTPAGSYKAGFIVWSQDYSETYAATETQINYKVAVTDPTFTATNTALAGPYSDGQVLKFATSLKANAGSPSGEYIVELRFLDTAGKTSYRHYFYSQSITTSAATALSFDYTISTTAPAGNYEAYFMVWSTDFSKAYSVTQAPISYAVKSAAPASLVITSGNDQGCTINKATTNPMVVLVKDSSGNVVKDATVDWTITTSGGKLSYASSVTSSTGYAENIFTCGASPQVNTITAKVSDTSLTVSFSQTSHMVLYQPSLSSLPSTVPILKANGSGDPLAGTGYLPDTGDKYTMVLDDEFDGTALDTTKWYTRYVYNSGTLSQLNDECENYNEDNTHIVSNGTLKLTARPLAGTVCANAKASGFTKWESGMIRSHTIVKYGYFEARVKMPKGVGVWPAFWLNPESGWPPEIDIFEYVRNGVTELPNMLHSGVVMRQSSNPQKRAIDYSDPYRNNTYGFVRPPSSTYSSTYFVDDFHVISAFWNDDDTVTMYIDGIPTVKFNYDWVHDNGTDGGYAHVLLNLAIGGSWPTDAWTQKITNSTQQLEVDYVRVYQKSAKIIKSTSTIGKDLCPTNGSGC